MVCNELLVLGGRDSVVVSAPDLLSGGTGFNSRQRQTTLRARGSPIMSFSRGRYIGISFDWGKVAALEIVLKTTYEPFHGNGQDIRRKFCS